MGASGLGGLLVKEGFLTEQDRLTITRTSGQKSWAFSKCVVSMGLLDDDELAAFFAERTKFQVASKSLIDELDDEVINTLNINLLCTLEVLPISRDDDQLTVAVADPLDMGTIRQLEFFTGCTVNPVIATFSQIYLGLKRIRPEYEGGSNALQSFLNNHAASAWQRQKLSTEEDDLDDAMDIDDDVEDFGDDDDEDIEAFGDDDGDEFDALDDAGDSDDDDESFDDIEGLDDDDDDFTDSVDSIPSDLDDDGLGDDIDDDGLGDDIDDALDDPFEDDESSDGDSSLDDDFPDDGDSTDSGLDEAAEDKK